MTTIQRQRIRLHNALDTLAPLYKEVIVLYHFEHLQYNEIAEVLGAPIGTIMNRIFRARKKLREAYVKLHVGSADGTDQASATAGWNLFEHIGRDQLPKQAWATR